MNEQDELSALGAKNALQLQPSTAVESLMNGKIKTAKWTKLLAVTSIASTLGSTVPTGYAIGVVNSPAAHMRQWCNESLIERYDLYLSANAIEVLWASIVSIFLIGGCIGSLGGAWSADKFGRKFTLLIGNILLIFAGLCFLSCRLLNSVEVLLFGRLIVGLASGLGIACLPMYLSEIAPLDLRGTLGVFCALGLCTGLVVGQVFSLQNLFGSKDLWHIALSLYVILIIISLIPYKSFPESPKWLLAIKDDKKKAQAELIRLRHPDEVDLIPKELELMSAEANESSETMGFMEVLSDRKLMLPLILVCGFQVGQQFSGINAIFFYSISIFKRAGLNESFAEWANLGAGCLNVCTSLMCPYLMGVYKRRSLMLFSTFFSFCALLFLTIMLYFIDSVSWFALGCVACIFFYIFFFQTGIGPIPFFIGSELFEVAPRPAAMSLGSLASFSGNFLVGMSFPSLQNMWGALVFLPFVIACALMFLLTLFYLPETKGQHPSDIAAIVSKGFKSKVRK